MTDPRYPVGPLEKQAVYSSDQRSAFIQIIQDAPEMMSRAVDGLTDAQLDTPYRQGGWTVRQLVHHVPDSHLNAYTRFKLALTEDMPTIKPYDEAEWAKLPDSSLGVDVSLTMLTALHERWVVLLRSIPDGDWKRVFNHPDNGHTTLEQALATYEWHSRHHVAHITTLRERMNW
jgi:hypothetical protein